MNFFNLPPNKKVGNYVWNHQAIIGRGAFGTVYLCHDEKNMEKVYAIKVVENSKLMDQYTKDAFINEVNILQKLSGRNTCGLIQFLQTANNKYIVQPFCDEGDLRNYLSRVNCMKENKAIVFFKQILAGMQEIISLNLIHRDLKPENILLNKGECVICDLGMGRSINQSQLLETSCGTPLYMAPQILKNEKYTNKSDIWSLGLIYFEMLYGKTPWNVKSQYELIQKCTTIPIKFPYDIQVSDQSKAFIKGCLQPQESKRFDWQQVFSYPLFQNQQQQQITQSFPQIKQLDNQCLNVINILQKAIGGSSQTLSKVFNKYDKRGSSTLDLYEFNQICMRLDSKLSLLQCQQIFKLFDVDNDNSITYQEFYNIIIDNDYSNKKDDNQVLLEYRAKAIVKKLRQIIYQNQINVIKLFKQLDTSNDGELDQNELYNLLNKIDTTLNKQQSNYVFDCFDTDKSGQLSFNEFLGLIQDKNQSQASYKSQQFINDADKTIDKIKFIINKNGINIDLLFLNFDEDRNGQIDKQEFQSFIQAIDRSLSVQYIQLLFSYLDDQQKGHIPIEILKQKILQK